MTALRLGNTCLLLNCAPCVERSQIVSKGDDKLDTGLVDSLNRLVYSALDIQSKSHDNSLQSVGRSNQCCKWALVVCKWSRFFRRPSQVMFPWPLSRPADRVFVESRRKVVAKCRGCKWYEVGVELGTCWEYSSYQSLRVDFGLPETWCFWYARIVHAPPKKAQLIVRDFFD